MYVNLYCYESKDMATRNDGETADDVVREIIVPQGTQSENH